MRQQFMTSVTYVIILLHLLQGHVSLLILSRAVQALPNTTFAQNNGVIVLSRCASRSAGIACGVWLILFGVLAKIGGWVSS